MKKTSKLAAILTALALALALTACPNPNSGDDSSGSSSSSSGTQTATTLDGTYSGTFSMTASTTVTLEFRSNGEIWSKLSSQTSFTNQGTYSIEGDSLSGTSGSGSQMLTYSGTKQTATTWSISVSGSSLNETFTITKQ